MVDLLAAKLIDERGPRAADPRSVINGWRRASSARRSEELSREQMLRLAGELGAGQLLVGGIVRTPAGLVISAELLAAPGGGPRARARVQGPPDSLSALIDRLIGQLLARRAGMEEQRVGILADKPLPALLAYVDGQAALRDGRYSEAIGDFNRALDVDSTFALAALGLRSASIFVPGTAHERSLDAAWAARDQLSRRDRAYLIAEAGPRYPAVAPAAERLAAWEAAVAAAPERPELWYRLGDRLFHDGALLALADWPERAVRGLRTAIELDSTFAAPYEHLLVLAARRGDTALVRQLGARYLARHAGSEDAGFIRWRMAQSLDDRRALERLRAGFDSMPALSLRSIALSSQFDGLALDDADRALTALRGRVSMPEDRADMLAGWHALALNRGRPGEALRITEEMRDVGPVPRPEFRHAPLHLRVLDALYSEGNATAAAEAARELAERADAPLPRASQDRRVQHVDICVAEQWRLWHGDVRTANRAIARLRGVAPEQVVAGVYAGDTVCAMLLETLLAVVAKRPVAAARLAQFDSVMQTGPPVNYAENCANLVVARLREAQGDRAGALAALRRRSYFQRWPQYLATYLREEGRLAALAGDTSGAIRAYEHYLALRSDPEPVVAAQTAEVRLELARLTRSRSRRD
jgi:tetratricopeptide (TPR) repeat protein